MLRKVYVWGDSIAKGIVFDAARGRYVGLRERSGFSRAAEALHVEMENHARFGMTSQRGRLALENGLQSAEPGSPVLLSFGGNDVDYDWAAISETPKERHDPHVLPEQFAENMAQMVRDARGAGLIPVLLTLPPIDSERYFSWVTRGLEKGENVLKWLGDVERIYRTHRGYSEILCQVARAVKRAPDRRARRVSSARGDSLRRLCVDGIHPNAEGHALIGQALTEYALAHGF